MLIWFCNWVLSFGIGGALWVLFAGRIIEGITGGSISTIFAYFADIIPKEQRTKYFGWVSAVVGVELLLDPLLGLTCKVWSFCTFILWSVHNFIKCFIWYEIHA